MIILEKYSDFMIFDLLDTGHRKKLEITEKEFINSKTKELLTDEAVLLIVKEEIRRIFIWKGIASNVRKKFIASRVASKLQTELVEEANFHRCKIVSIDQGDETKEFLKAFKLKPIKVDKPENKIPLYQRENKSSNVSSASKIPKDTSEFYMKVNKNKESDLKFTSTKMGSKKPPEQKESILNANVNEYAQHPVPEGYVRKHLLIGTSDLYGIVRKKSEIFGEIVEEEDWEKIKEIPDEMIELEGHKLRIHLNKTNVSVIAIEILEKISKKSPQEKPEKERLIDLDFNRWTLNALRKFCSNHDITISSSNKKAEIIKMLEEKYL